MHTYTGASGAPHAPESGAWVFKKRAHGYGCMWGTRCTRFRVHGFFARLAGVHSRQGAVRLTQAGFGWVAGDCSAESLATKVRL